MPPVLHDTSLLHTRRAQRGPWNSERRTLVVWEDVVVKEVQGRCSGKRVELLGLEMEVSRRP